MGPVGYIPDVSHDNKTLWAWAGVNFGEHNCMLLQKSLSRLAAQTGCANLRFWGKVSGLNNDYWIAEGSGDAGAEGEEVERPFDMEPRGAPGVN